MRRFLTRFRAWRAARIPLVTALTLAWYGLTPIMGGADTTSTTLAADFATYIADKTLMLAQKDTRLKNIGDKATLPTRSSKTFQYTRYERLALPQTTATEGVTPDSTQMSISTVSATVEQWIQIVVLTDVAELVIKHPVVTKAIELLGLAAAETVDREIQKTLLAGTNVQYVNSRSSRATLVATDVMTTNEVRKAVSTLRTAGARGYDMDAFLGVVDPAVESDMTADPTFVAAAQYSAITALYTNELGKWMGVRWIRDNFLHTFLGVANSAITLADVTTGGTIAQTITVYVVVTGVNTSTGFEERLVQEKSVTTATDGLSTHKVNVTVPSTTGYTYNIYAGTVSGTTYLVTSGVAVSAVSAITTVPTSGTTNPPVPATGITSHVLWIFGKEGFTVIELDGMSLQTFVTPKGSTDSDPAMQRRKLGWKLMWKSVITNANFFRRIECATAY